jgi:hypothetical protein
MAKRTKRSATKRPTRKNRAHVKRRTTAKMACADFV